MSFDIVCPSCGAPSAPSVGVCPFCKSVFSGPKGNKGDTPTLNRIKALYEEGRLDSALSLAREAEVQKSSLLKNINFILLYVKLLLEVDGPSSKMKSLLASALLEEPNDPVLLEYLEVVEAKSLLSRNQDEQGVLELTNVIRRSPKNVHALFLLGSHLFWNDKETQRSLRMLEICTRLRPNFLRANACLGAIYKQLGLSSQAAQVFKKCVALEFNPEMKNYFKQLAAG